MTDDPNGRAPDRPRFYLTTAIAYPNNKPGLHTLYEVVGADVIARWHRMHGFDTRFLTGTDEHSVNIHERARELGTDTRDFVDEMVGLFLSVGDIVADRREAGGGSSVIGERQDLVSHPASGAGLEVAEADLDFALSIAQHLRQELAEDPGPILRKEELPQGRLRRLLEALQPHHVQPGAIDEEWHALQIAQADEVLAVFQDPHEPVSLGFGANPRRHVAHDLRGRHHHPGRVGDR